MRALVTGADGFVGRHLMSHLEAEGDTSIGWDRSTGGPDLLHARDVTQLFEDVHPDVVYHLAGDADVGGSWDHPESTFMINAVGTMHVLMAARRAGVQRVLCVSSADVYGRVTEDDLPLTEDAACCRCILAPSSAPDRSLRPLLSSRDCRLQILDSWSRRRPRSVASPHISPTFG